MSTKIVNSSINENYPCFNEKRAGWLYGSQSTKIIAQRRPQFGGCGEKFIIPILACVPEKPSVWNKLLLIC